MTWVDAALLALLLVGFPGRALWRSLPGKAPEAEGKTAPYLATMVAAAGAVAALILDWQWAGRGYALLGLVSPIGANEAIRLSCVLIALLALGIFLVRRPTPSGPPREGADILPTSREERLWFLATATFVSIAWELLYRGYALWALEPRVGTVGAVAIAATAYGCAHGYKSPRQFVGALVAALAFTVAFAATRTLWWLILLHVGLPLVTILAASPRERHPAARQQSALL
jgi:membrane protease YdiL (CAAX protease family)